MFPDPFIGVISDQAPDLRIVQVAPAPGFVERCDAPWVSVVPASPRAQQQLHGPLHTTPSARVIGAGPIPREDFVQRRAAVLAANVQSWTFQKRELDALKVEIPCSRSLHQPPFGTLFRGSFIAYPWRRRPANAQVGGCRNDFGGMRRCRVVRGLTEPVRLLLFRVDLSPVLPNHRPLACRQVGCIGRQRQVRVKRLPGWRLAYGRAGCIVRRRVCLVTANIRRTDPSWGKASSWARAILSRLDGLASARHDVAIWYPRTACQQR